MKTSSILLINLGQWTSILCINDNLCKFASHFYYAWKKMKCFLQKRLDWLIRLSKTFSVKYESVFLSVMCFYSSTNSSVCQCYQLPRCSLAPMFGLTSGVLSKKNPSTMETSCMFTPPSLPGQLILKRCCFR